MDHWHDRQRFCNRNHDGHAPGLFRRAARDQGVAPGCGDDRWHSWPLIDFTLSKGGDIFFRAGKSAGGFQPGEKVRAIVVDVNGAVVLLAIEVFDPAAFDKEMTAAQPILDSIVWN
jgi:hypothetical protein